MRTLILVAIACLAVMPSLRAADLDMTGLDTPRDKQAAGSRLLSWVRSLGYDAILSKDGEDVFIRDLKLTLSPVLNDDSGIDRLIVYNAYSGKPGNVSNPRVPSILAKINGKQIAAKVSVAAGGTVLFDTSLAFDNTLSPRLFRAFLEHSNKAAEMLIGSNPELAELIE